MKEYTILVGLSLVICFILDQFVVKTKLYLQIKFWVFLGFVILLQTIVDNWLNGRWWNEGFLVGPYDPVFYSGIKIWETPLENYFFGIALLWMNLIFFEGWRGVSKTKSLNRWW